MKRTLIVYYSRTGTARRAAEQLSEITHWPVAEVRDVRTRTGFLGDLRCIADSLLFRTPSYELIDAELMDFERLVVVTPIWMAQMAGPVRSFLRDRFRSGAMVGTQQVALVCVMGREGAFNAAAEVARIAGRPPFPVLALRQNDVLDGSCEASLASLATSFTSLDEPRAPMRPRWLSPEAS